MKAREVNRRIEKLGGTFLRQRGSHKRYEATKIDSNGNIITAQTSVPQHPGDIPTGTLHAIEKELETIFGKGWLT